MGSVDVATIVHSLAGTKVTFHSTALTKIPSLKLSTTETAFSSQAEVTAIVKTGVARVTANSLYTVAATAFVGAFDAADILGGVYQGVWGPGTNDVTFQTMSGWDIEFDLELEPQYADGVGTYDMILKGVTVRAKCTPIGVSETTLLGYLNLQDSGAVMGGTMRNGYTLTISCYPGLTVVLNEAVLKTGPLAWGSSTLRTGEIGFVAHRLISDGVPAALYSVAMTEAPAP
jgi:hypothetical protein